ncbi:MAG: DUF1156 domain-containing protein [Dehalococcoidia bacterium]|nr:DUF1156 domain-containing protein [Dehalococcoidia bacterium]
MTTVRTRKKLIEVALPLEAINKESLRRKQKAPKGWPTSFHKWWAQRPLAAARAVIFASLVDDPSAVSEEFPSETEQHLERQRLFRLIEELVQWDNTRNDAVMRQAREAIAESWRRACSDNGQHPNAGEWFRPERLPTFWDPFAGSGSLPLTAQWLGLESRASDFNPVAVVINKALIEIPARFRGQPPVNPVSRTGSGSTSAGWRDAAGLSEDVRHYGQWMRDEARRRIGYLYPDVTVTAEMAQARPDLGPCIGTELTVVALLWARTVKSPNPAFADIDVPLATTFVLSTTPGREAHVEPVLDAKGYRFVVKPGKPDDPEGAKGTASGKRNAFQCVMSGVPITYEYIRDESAAGRLGARLMAIVADGPRGRFYLAPTAEQEAAARQARPEWRPEVEFFQQALGFRVGNYGMNNWGDLFTSRQLVALTTFADLVADVRHEVHRDATLAGLPDDPRGFESGGVGAVAYAEAVSVYLACAVDRMAYYGSTLTTWLPKDNALRDAMPRQALAMTWDFAEGNPFGKSSGDAATCLNAVCNYIEVATPFAPAAASQGDAQSLADASGVYLFSTDPPYYDNVGYADLSDFFYVWMRRSLKSIFPDLFSTLSVPKAEELVATPGRHGGKDKAEAFFLEGMSRSMNRVAQQAHPTFPVTIYYAFKQAEGEGGTEFASTGWETFLQAVIRSGFTITGTLPMRTEGGGRLRASQSNALASSIVLVCRPRRPDAPRATRSEFLQELSAAMRETLPVMTGGEIAPVDLAQASIGPGMAVYSKFSQVLRQDGKPVTVREALQDINNAVAAYRAERTSSFDEKTRFCIDFYEQFGFGQAPFGDAQNLARAKNVGVNTLEDEHLLVAEAGKAWLVALKSYPVGVAGLERAFAGSAWEACLRLAATLREEGEAATAALARELGEGVCARARELAVWLYTIADARKRSQDALAFNALDASWPEIQRLLASMDRGGQQGRFA